MNILGIETSCDETAAAVVKDGNKILSSVVTSSEALHQRFGGIIPEQAAREQLKVIIPVIDQALHEAFPQKNNVTMKSRRKVENPVQANALPGQCNNEVSAIAVTYGPGLIGSLIVGTEAAKTLSFTLNKPLIPVNHLLGHIYANFLYLNRHAELDSASLKNSKKIPKQVRDDNRVGLPAVCLVASGGHTDLLLMGKNHTFKVLGSTRDDAAGECLDKTARLLGLGYPGGPAIEKAATSYQQPTTRKPVSQKKLATGRWRLATVSLPRPMIHEDNFDFSFSGLKTAVLTLTKQAGLGSDPKQNRNKRVRPFSKQFVNFMACEIQEAITDVLVTKTVRAAKEHQVKSILVGGGVAANSRLREKFETTMKQWSNGAMKLFIPDKKLCTDNAAVIAATAFYQNKPVDWHTLKPNPSPFLTYLS